MSEHFDTPVRIELIIDLARKVFSPLHYIEVFMERWIYKQMFQRGGKVISISQTVIMMFIFDDSSGHQTGRD